MFTQPNPAHLQSKATRAIASLALRLFAVAAIQIALPSDAAVAHLLAPADLRCANDNEPMAVDAAQPEFSWRLKAASETLHSVSQSAYQVTVYSVDGAVANPQPLWDSGVVHRSTLAGILYAGPAPKEGHRYQWKVRVWDEAGKPSAWSEVAHWTQAPMWTASWIAAHSAEAQENGEPMPVFRKSFVLDKKITRATLYASGLGQDELRINGNKVGGDLLTPGWSDYRKTVYYDSYNVTRLLHDGKNAIGILLGNGMYRVLKMPDRYIKFDASFGIPKCIVQLHVEFADGESTDIKSDGSWKTAPGPITFSSTYGGEDFDSRREQPGWDLPAFADASWQPAVVVEGPGGRLQPELAPPLRMMHSYAPIKVSQPKPGVTVYDLGQNLAGWPAITAVGPAGAVVKLTPGELLAKDGTVSQSSSGAPQWFSLTLRGGELQHWHPRFSYYGFRFVQIETSAPAGAPGEVRIVSLRGEAVHTSSPAVGSFVSSEELLNRIHKLIVRAIENNAVSLFTDCPHREKLGWLEQVHLMANSMLYDFDFSGLFAATARNIADAQVKDGPKLGMVPEIAPQYVVFGSDGGVFDDSPEWGSAAVLAPWYIFQRSGDLQFLAAQLDVMRGYTSYLGTRAKDGIVAYGLGDWYDIGPGEPGFSKLTTAGVTATAIYYQDLRVLEQATELLGKTEESRGYRSKADAIRTAFNRRFFDPLQHRYDKGSQTAEAMPLSVGLVPEGESTAVLQALVDDIRAHNNHVTAGDIGYHYVVDALIGSGRSDVLLDMLERTDTPSYGYQLAQGATALTEAWDANPANSQDHFMLGHAEEWFYRGLGGIDIDDSAQGDKQLIFHPAVMKNLAWVRTEYQSAAGLIQSNWRRESSRTVYDFVVPVNTKAMIELSTAKPGAVTVNGVSTGRSRGVLSAQVSDNAIQMVVGSGRYRVIAARGRDSSNH